MLAKPAAMVGRLLASLPSRRTHSLAVGAEAERVAGILEPADREPLIVAAYLHDVGYAPALVASGAHQLDGARALRREGFDDRVCRLVAHHSGAIHEARERGLADELTNEFAPPESDVLAVLTYCDMSIGPTGDPVFVAERLADIFARYDVDHVVYRAIRSAEADLKIAVAAVRRRLDAAGLAYR